MIKKDGSDSYSFDEKILPQDLVNDWLAGKPIIKEQPKPEKPAAEEEAEEPAEKKKLKSQLQKKLKSQLQKKRRQEPLQKKRRLKSQLQKKRRLKSHLQKIRLNNNLSLY